MAKIKVACFFLGHGVEYRSLVDIVCSICGTLSTSTCSGLKTKSVVDVAHKVKAFVLLMSSLLHRGNSSFTVICLAYLVSCN